MIATSLVAGALVFVLLSAMLLKRKQFGSVRGCHVLVTGGSEGLGFAIAKEFAHRGAAVTIVARTKEKLESAQRELQSVAPNPSLIRFQSADVTRQDEVKAAIDAAQQELGDVDIVVCNAGRGDFGYLQDVGVEGCRSMMEMNYFSAVHTVMSVYRGMLARRRGHICFICSTLGQLSFCGSTAYSASKYAMRGLAEALRNECQGTGISISIAFPPDVDTPGLAKENINKPPETVELSKGGGLYSGERVAKGVVQGILGGQFILPNPEPLLVLLTCSVRGFSPRTFPGVLLDMISGALTPLILWAWVAYADRVALRGAARRLESVERNGT